MLSWRKKNYSGAELLGEIERQLNAHFTGSGDVADKYKDEDGKVIKVRWGSSAESGLATSDSNQSGHIVLEGATAFISNISVSAFSSTNTGYDDIFVGEKRIPVPVPKTGSATKIVLPDNMATVGSDGKVTISGAYTTLKVKIDGESDWREVKVGGTWDSYDKLAEHITKELSAFGEPISFGTYKAQGTTKTVTPREYAHTEGETTSEVSKYTYTKQGYTHRTGPEGETGTRDQNDAPVVTLEKALTGEIQITEKNKWLNFDLTLGKEGNYTVKKVQINLMDLLPTGQDKFADISAFCTAVQGAVNTQLGVEADNYGGVKVAPSGNKVTLTGGLKDTVDPDSDVDAAKVKISMDTKEGGFLYALHGKDEPASYTVDARETKTGKEQGSSTRNLNTSAVSNGQTIRITLKQPASEGGEVTKDVILNGNYSQLQDAVDLAFGKNKIKVSTPNNRLKFTTIGSGDDYDIQVDEANSPALGALFGYVQDDGSYANTSKNMASGDILRKVEKEFTYDASDNRSMTIKVDDQPYDIELDAGVKYGDGKNGTTDIAKAIRDKVNAKAGKKILSDDCAVNGNGYIYLETEAENGAASKIEAVYDEKSAMRKIFGETPKAGAKAEFVQDADGNVKLQLTRVQDPAVPDSAYPSNKSLYVVSHVGTNGALQGGPFVMPEKEPIPPKSVSGHDPGNYSYIDGVDLVLNQNGNLEIDEYNNVLNFYYTDHYVSSSDPANPQQIRVTITPGEWDLALLQKTLQEAIDKQTDNKRKLEVTVDPKGVRIQSAKSGSQYRVYTSSDRVYQNYTSRSVSPSGSFYDKVMCQAAVNTTIYNAKEKPGHKSEEDVYAVGRQDVTGREIKIQKDGNDELSLELTVPGKADPYKLEMKLEPGYYQGNSLVQQVQTQLDKALIQNGLPAGLVEAGIDIIKTATTIVGSLNDKALTFKLSDKVQGPAEGRYGIDAIGGTAAYSVFYQTDGDITRAYIKGGKDISQGVEIKDGATDFSVDVDGKTYQIALDPGKYTAEELAAHITGKFQNLAEPCPLRAIVDDGYIKLMHNQFGKHKINNLKGSVKNQLFFIEKGEKEAEDIHLRLSSVSGDWTNIERPWMNTVSLGINSLTLSKVKYAQKAIGRIKEAVTRASEVRSYFGAKQNQLESTIRNNENKAENTAASESRIRDADISGEMVENSIHSILEQTGTSILAQAKQNAQLALQMLS